MASKSRHNKADDLDSKSSGIKVNRIRCERVRLRGENSPTSIKQTSEVKQNVLQKRKNRNKKV